MANNCSMHHRCCTLVFQLSNKLINPPPPNRLHMSQREDYKRSIGGVGEIQKRNCNKKYLGQLVTQIDNISLIAQSNKKKKNTTLLWQCLFTITQNSFFHSLIRSPSEVTTSCDNFHSLEHSLKNCTLSLTLGSCNQLNSSPFRP